METKKQKKICLVASAGGHLSQLLKLESVWEGYETFCVTTTDVTKKTLQQYGKVYVVGECNHKHPIKVIKVLFRSVKIVLKQKPDVIISTGAAVGCMICFLGKLLDAKIIWIDSITNINRLSLSGRMVRYIAHLFLVQWPKLAEQYDNTEYVGALI